MFNILKSEYPIVKRGKLTTRDRGWNTVELFINGLIPNAYWTDKLLSLIPKW